MKLGLLNELLRGFLNDNPASGYGSLGQVSIGLVSLG